MRWKFSHLGTFKFLQLCRNIELSPIFVLQLIFSLQGYISHQHQKLVVSKQNPFPPIMATWLMIHSGPVSREYWMIYRTPGFGSTLTPSPPLSRQQARRATHRKIEKERQHADGSGGEEPNHTTARKPGPLHTIQYSVPTSNPLVGKQIQIFNVKRHLNFFAVFS